MQNENLGNLHGMPKGVGSPVIRADICRLHEGAVAYIECYRGHKSAVLLQSQKFEILLESAANALLEGYTIEAASSLSAAYERFFEFSINVFCKKNAITKQALEETFKQVSKQSERQIGGFLFLHLITFGSNYALSKKIPELRNKIVHQGYIPTPEEVIAFGELIYQEIYSITQLLKSSMQSEMQQVIMDDLQSKSERISPETPRATSTGAMFFSLSMAEQKRDFHEALASYKDAKEVIIGSVPYMKLLNKAVSLYSKLRGGV